MAVCGAIYALYAFNMDVSVTAPSYGGYGGGQVANLDLMAQRQNHSIFSAVLFLAGVCMAIFGHHSEQSILNDIKPFTHKTSNFEDERDLANDAYKLWLAGEYSIERNDVFQKFTVSSEVTFESLDEALAYAGHIETEKFEAFAASNAEKTEEPEEDQEANGKIAATAAIATILLIMVLFSANS